jgi:hypothetical protein
MAPVALVVMRVPVVLEMIVMGMVVATKPRNVKMRPSAVIGRLAVAALPMRVRHGYQLAGQISNRQHERLATTQHQPLAKAT